MRAHKTVLDERSDLGIPPAPEPPRGSGRLYAATWGILAALAVGYMTTLVLKPDWAAPLTTQSLRSTEPPVSSEVVAQLTGEVDSLRKTIAALQEELSAVKSNAAAREVEIINQQARADVHPPSDTPQQTLELAKRQYEQEETESAAQNSTGSQETATAQVSANTLELRTTRSEPALPEDQPEAPPLVQQATAIRSLPDVNPLQLETVSARETEPAAKTEPEVARSEPQKKRPKPALIPPPPAPVRKVAVVDVKPAIRPAPQPAVESAPVKQRRVLPLATGSLPPAAPPAITFGPPTVTPASDAFAVLLDAGPSLEALRLRWSVLSDRHKAALGELEPRYVVSGPPSAPSYELLAGPIASAEEASRICALLRVRRVSCNVGGPFAGEAL